jgi:hypothetical protein
MNMDGDYRERAPAEFETPWFHLGLSAEQRRACIAAGLALSAAALAVAVDAHRKPDLAHLGALIASGGLACGLLAAGWPPEDVFDGQREVTLRTSEARSRN